MKSEDTEVSEETAVQNVSLALIIIIKYLAPAGSY